MSDNTKVNQPTSIHISKAKTNKHLGEGALAGSGLSAISIDTQSFVNLGQLIGSRGHDIASNSMAVSNNNNSVLGATGSFLSGGGSDSDPDGLRDFDQIFHPTASTCSGAWSGHDLCSDGEVRGEDHGHDHDDDDNDSVLPALPRTPSPGFPMALDRCLLDALSGASKRRPFLGDEPSGALSWLSQEGRGGEPATADGIGGTYNSGEGADTQGFMFPSARYSTRGVGAYGLDFGPREVAAEVSVTPGMVHVEGCTNSNNSDDAETKLEDESEREQLSSALLDASKAVEDAVAGGALGASEASSPLRESWLHVPMDSNPDNISDHVSGHGTVARSPNSTGMIAEGELYGETKQDEERVGLLLARIGRRTVRGDCGCCFACGLDTAVALVRPPLQRAVELAKGGVEAGAEALVKAQEVCAKGHEAVMKAVDNVPQAPVRMWLGRIAGSFVLGAILGGAAAYYAFPRIVTTWIYPSTPSGYAFDAGSTDSGSSRGVWGMPGTQHPQHHRQQDSAGGPERSFGDRLNTALFAARAGEAAAQQGLLEEVRNILAATGKSGGISAEQLLRQFNAKRFAEASKAWSAAEGVMGEDPLFYMPPYKPPPAASHSASEPRPQQQPQQQQQQQEQYHSSQGNGPAQMNHENVDRMECAEGEIYRETLMAAGAGNGGGACASPRAESAGGGASRGSVNKPYPRACRGGGWIC